MKRCIREKEEWRGQENVEGEIHGDIRKEVEYASSQLKNVNLQVLAMEQKTMALAN
jgi:hypothetical protein